MVPADTRSNIGAPQPRWAPASCRTRKNELDESRFAAGLLRSGAFTWRRHNDPDRAGYRLVVDADPETHSTESVAAELAAAVLHGLRRAALIRR